MPHHKALVVAFGILLGLAPLEAAAQSQAICYSIVVDLSSVEKYKSPPCVSIGLGIRQYRACMDEIRALSARIKQQSDAAYQAAKDEREACYADLEQRRALAKAEKEREKVDDVAFKMLNRDITKYLGGANPYSNLNATKRVSRVAKYLESIQQEQFGIVDSSIASFALDPAAAPPIQTTGRWAAIGNPPSATALAEQDREWKEQLASRQAAAEAQRAETSRRVAAQQQQDDEERAERRRQRDADDEEQDANTANMLRGLMGGMSQPSVRSSQPSYSSPPSVSSRPAPFATFPGPSTSQPSSRSGDCTPGVYHETARCRGGL